MSDDRHDFSRLDQYMRNRQRVAFMHSVWRPMLAGAAGAALVVAAVYVTLPRFSVREVVVPQVTMKPVDVPDITLKPVEVPVDKIVPHEVVIDVPKIVTHDAPPPAKPPTPAPAPPIASPDMGPPAPYAAKTPAEAKFVDKPEYKDARYHGRIIKSVDGHELSFQDGMNFHPAHWDDAAGHIVYDPDDVIPSDPFIGDLGMCTPEPGHPSMWDCVVMHDGVEIPIGAPPHDANTDTQIRMVMVDVMIGDYPIAALVDTGCAFPMSVPKVYADLLIKIGLAERFGEATSILADGTEHRVDMIVIHSITVDGRTLRNVAASVIPNPNAPILLGLGALNQLGAFSIEGRRLVFTGQPT